MREDNGLSETEISIDTGLHCLLLISQYFRIATDADEILHDLGKTEGKLSSDEVLLAAKRLDFKTRRARFKLNRLSKAPVPVIAEMSDGTFVILHEVHKDKIIINDPRSTKLIELTPADFEKQWSGHLILLTTRANVTGAMRRFDLSWFIPEIVRYRRLLKEVLLATLFVQILALLSPVFFQLVIDKVLVHHGLTTLHVLIIGLAAVSLFEVILSGLRSYVTSHTSSKVDVSLGSRLFNHLMSLPISYFESHPAGQSISRVRELENIRAFLTGSTMSLSMDMLFIVVFFFVMWFYSPFMTLMVLASIPCYLLLWLVTMPLLKRRIEEKFARSAENETFLVESVNGIETLKSMALEPQIQRRWDDQLAGYTRASFEALKITNISTSIAQLIYRIVIATVLWYGAQLVIQGNITVGQLIAFIMLTACISIPALRLTKHLQDYQQLRVSINRLGDIMNLPVEADHETARSTLKDLEGSILFENVSFRYGPNEPEVLSGINIDVKPGEVIGIAGPSGSGKSTLIKLLQRLHTPESGRIMVDGIDIAMANPRWLRRQIGIVLQENVLFNRTVRENIALANPAMDFDQIVNAAKLAGAHDFIVKLPKGYDTVLVERGANLSGGQRQRVAIARALATDPRILIFDEATSSLDYVSEYVIEQNMADMAKGRTVFVVSHRLPAIRKASRIITIEQGSITEEGTHKELMRNNGRYAQLYKLQSYGDDGNEGW